MKTEEGAAGPPRVLSLSEVAERLGMKRPNVAKFLARRGVEPVLAKAQGYFWAEAEIERVKAEREADTARIAADRQRRETAVRRARGEAAPEPDSEPAEEAAPVRLGATQKLMMEQLMRRPVTSTNENRFALLRLARRGYAERIDGQREYQLTALGRSVAGSME